MDLSLFNPGVMSSNEFVGPGAYNTLEEEETKKKYASKHQGLLKTTTSASKKSGLAKVGKNFISAKGIVPEFEETQRRLKEQQLRQLADGKFAFSQPYQDLEASGPGPGQYSGILDWRIESKRKSYNLRYY